MLFSPGPVGEEVGVNISVNVGVGLGVGLGLQVIPRGLGVHWPSLPHTAVISPSGTNPGSHWNTTIEPSVVLVWGCNRDPLIGSGRGPQSAVGLVTVTLTKATSLQATYVCYFQPYDHYCILLLIQSKKDLCSFVGASWQGIPKIGKQVLSTISIMQSNGQAK